MSERMDLDARIAALAPFPPVGFDAYDLSALDQECAAIDDRRRLAIDMLKEMQTHWMGDGVRARCDRVLEACRDAE